MKEIKIKHNSISERAKEHWNTKFSRLHYVYLHSDLARSFTVMREAESFINQTNSFLNVKLYEINEIYIELFILYRRSWFYFDKRINDIRLITTSLGSVNKALEYITEKQDLDGYSHIVFNSLKYIIRDFKTIIEIVQDLYRSRNHWSEIKVLDSLLSRIEFINNQIFTYGFPQIER